MKTITKHLIPNVGTLVIIGLLFLAQSVGALPGPAPSEPQAAPSAASQTVISYQGTLTDPGGNPINGTVTMEFALYDAATGGNRLWGPETQTVEVSDGLFHVLLGSVETIDPANLTGNLYLSITVNGEDMSPRELLTGILYAMSLSEGAIAQGDLTVSDQLYVQGGWKLAGLAEGNINMDGKSLYNVGKAYFGNIYGNGSQQIHMPSNPAGNMYLNWHTGKALYFGGKESPNARRTRRRAH